MKDSQNISNKAEMLCCFQKHIIASRSIFDSLIGTHVNPPIVQSDAHVVANECFIFTSLILSEVCNALKLLDSSNSDSPGKLGPYI